MSQSEFRAITLWELLFLYRFHRRQIRFYGQENPYRRIVQNVLPKRNLLPQALIGTLKTGQWHRVNPYQLLIFLERSKRIALATTNTELSDMPIAACLLEFQSIRSFENE